jgi:protein-tyrosine phosphatase
VIWLVEAVQNYSRIEPGLYMGGSVSRPPLGTTAVINLCEKPDRYEAPVHIWEPIPDGPPAPSLDWLRKMVRHVEDNRREGRTVYVHCLAGVSRAALVVIAYLMHRDRCTLDEALARVRQGRRRAQPNPAFMERLREWEKVCLAQITSSRT